MFKNSTILTLLYNRFTGLILVFILSILILAIFYGKVISSLNTTYFSTDGDGIQSYYNTYYLAKYDTTLMYSHSMNYPYGEVAFYSLSQPLVAGTLKFISNNFVDVTPYTVGILNFLMLFSVVLAAVFLYLILIETGLSVYPALIISVGIAFLSPQIDRFGGHFTLSYVCAIPLLLYLLLLFHKRHCKILYSSLTGAVVFVLMTGMVYFATFFAIILLFYWSSVLLSKNNKTSIPRFRILLHIALQLIIPVLVFYLITSQFSHLSPDKPSRPYGFLVYKASPESVLLPLWIDYGRFLHKIRNFSYVQWEGISYVGITAALGFMVILASLIKKIYRRNWKELLLVTDNFFLNILFWASFVALLYSFGLPFIFGLEFLVEYLGPLQQIRSIGRFAWLFYFVINLVVFYRIWRWQQFEGKKHVKTMALILCMTFLYADVYFFLKYRQGYLNNKFPVWSDFRNTEPDNQWVGRIEPEKYQAILPLPLYHMGSDNYGMNPRCNMLANSFLVSMKTGLPVAAIYLSRASISQSIKNIALALEPYREFRILKDLPDKRPLLIVSARCNEFTSEEKNILHFADRIDSSGNFYLYQLDYDSLLMIPQRKEEEMKKEFAKNQVQILDSIHSEDSTSLLRYLSFDEQGQDKGYQGKAMLIKGRSASLLFENYISSTVDSNLLVSFWCSPMNVDLFPKTRLEIELFNEAGEKYKYINEMLGAFLKTIDGSWGLIEYRIHLAKPGSRVKIKVYNTQIGKKQSYQIDELLIRPENYNVYCSRGNYISKNNRWFIANPSLKTPQ
jgi:hypothetical protein